MIEPHWSVFKDEYSDWRFQLIDDDGAIVLESEPYQQREECERMLNKVRGLASQTLRIDIEPYPGHIRAGDMVDADVRARKGLFDV